jgi:hypothetical protein
MIRSRLSAEDIEQARIEAWRACRSDTLHSDPKMLADALFDLDGSAVEPLADLLAALTARECGALAGDNMVMQYAGAMRVIDRLVAKVVKAEERRGNWIDFEIDEDEV